MSKITFEFARLDDCLDKMVPSDLREVVAERDRLRERNEALEELVVGLEEVRSKEYEFKQARIEALEDFNYRRRKAYRDRVIDALHNIDTEESPELEDALNLAHNAIYNAVTKALLEGE